LIEVRNLTKRYAGHAAVSDLSFTVKEGQVYGFLGPNGAGKSTTMNIMAGYLSPSEGEVIINGYDILEEPEKAKATIGYLPEIPPVYDDLTVEECITFAAELKGVPKKEVKAAVAKAVEELELGEVRKRLVRNLSKGFRQRVGFAQALVNDPDTLILDEPTVGLDPKQIREIRHLIKELGKKHTVILSSHILSEVSEICDEILIISKGKLVALDTPENLEKRLGGSSEVTVVSPAGEKELSKALAPFGEASFSKEGGLTKAQVAVTGEEDLRDAICRKLIEEKCLYYSVSYAKTSLEDVFLALTSDGAEAAPLDADDDAAEGAEGEAQDAAGEAAEAGQGDISGAAKEAASLENDSDNAALGGEPEADLGGDEASASEEAGQ